MDLHHNYCCLDLHHLYKITIKRELNVMYIQCKIYLIYVTSISPSLFIIYIHLIIYNFVNTFGVVQDSVDLLMHVRSTFNILFFMLIYHLDLFYWHERCCVYLNTCGSTATGIEIDTTSFMPIKQVEVVNQHKK